MSELVFKAGVETEQMHVIACVENLAHEDPKNFSVEKFQTVKEVNDDLYRRDVSRIFTNAIVDSPGGSIIRGRRNVEPGEILDWLRADILPPTFAGNKVGSLVRICREFDDPSGEKPGRSYWITLETYDPSKPPGPIEPLVRAHASSGLRVTPQQYNRATLSGDPAFVPSLINEIAKDMSEVMLQVSAQEQ